MRSNLYLTHATGRAAAASVLCLLFVACSSSHQGADAKSSRDGGHEDLMDGASEAGTADGAAGSVAADASSDASSDANDGDAFVAPPGLLWRDGGGLEAVPEEFMSCVHNSECALFAKTCCAPCGAVASDYLAFRTLRRAEVYDSACEGTVCQDIECLGAQWVQAACIDGQCDVVDLRQRDEFTGCTQHSDCHVRKVECCNCGGVELGAERDALIAVSDEAAYAAIACSVDDVCESPCTLSVPEEITAYCNHGYCDLASPNL